MKTSKLPWYFLLFFLCINFVSGAQEIKKGNIIEMENDSLNLIYRKIPVKDFNGSAYTIKGEEIRTFPVTNLTNVLSGLVPGFFPRQSQGGMVNESADYWIRGIRSYLSGALVLVDGQERDFGILSPYEISDITVLKDAAATVLYGMRGANGVVLVNTLKGQTGKPSVEFTTQLIKQQPIKLLTPLNASTYAENYNVAIKNDGMDETNMYSAYYLSQYRQGVNSELYPDINWLDEYYRKNTWLQRYNLNISGGSGRTRYFLNGGFLTQSGMFKTDDEFTYSTNNRIDRYNIRSNVEVDVTTTTLLSLDLYGWYEKQNRPGGDSYGAYYALLTTPPNAFPPYYIDNGNYIDQSGNAVTSVNQKIIAGNGIHTNPWAMLNRSGYTALEKVYGSFLANLTQDLSVLTKGLKISLIFSMDTQSQSAANRTKKFAYYQLTNPDNPLVLKKTGTDEKMSNSVSNKYSERRNALDIQLSYNRQFSKHSVYGLVFYNQYENSKDVSIPSRFQGGGTWLNYNYNNRYSVDFMSSIQACYKFAKGSRTGVFPTVAVGWTISNESFFRELKEYITYLKLKGSYGWLGNHSGVSEFRYMGRLSPTSGVYNFGNAMNNANGYIEDIIAYPGLTWEKVEQINIGVDMKLFQDRLSLSAEYFRDNRSDMYVTNQRVPSLLGITVDLNENIGKMYTRGVDLAAMWKESIGEVAYMIGGSYSFSKNKVTALGEIDQPYPWLQDIGYFRDVKRGYIAEGLFQSYDEIAAAPRHTFSEVQPGDIRYKDVNGDGIIDTNDQVPIGYSDTPQGVYGLTVGISYKGFGINVLFNGVSNVSRFIKGPVAYPYYAKGNIYSHQLDYWTPENPVASLPRISTISSGGVNNIQNSSFWLSNADFLRLNTLELYYDFPLASKSSFLKGMKFFINGYNLYTWTNYHSFLDPEAAGDGSGMPIMKNIALGCSFKF